MFKWFRIFTFKISGWIDTSSQVVIEDLISIIVKRAEREKIKPASPRQQYQSRKQRVVRATLLLFSDDTNI